MPPRAIASFLHSLSRQTLESVPPLALCPSPAPVPTAPPIGHCLPTLPIKVSKNRCAAKAAKPASSPRLNSTISQQHLTQAIPSHLKWFLFSTSTPPHSPVSLPTPQ